MTRTTGVDRYDGGWWPRSRDLAVELVDLVDHLPPEHGRVERALFSPPDWDTAPQRVRAAGTDVDVGPLPRDDAHLLELHTTGHTVLRLLVVPPAFSGDQGAEALLAAATAGNAHAAEDLLDVVSEHPDVDPADHWHDSGDSWWGKEETAPSFRTGRRAGDRGEPDARPG